jgi:hypothetical protein
MRVKGYAREAVDLHDWMERIHYPEDWMVDVTKMIGAPARLRRRIEADVKAQKRAKRALRTQQEAWR